MTEAPAADATPFAASDIEALARDWITLWQSELSSFAGDREAAETWHRLLALWAGTAMSLVSAVPHVPPGGVHESSAGRAGPAAETRPPAAPAAPDARDAALERLDHRLARLEERLEALERAIRASVGPVGRSSRGVRRGRRGSVPSRGAG